MTVIVFNGRSYTPEVLATMSLEDLNILHDKVRDATDGGGEGADFAYFQDAQAETWDLMMRVLGPARPEEGQVALLEINEPQAHPPKRGAAPEDDTPPHSPGPLTPAEPLKRTKVFRFPVGDEIKKTKPGTLRASVVDALRAGATFEEVVLVVQVFDAKRNVAEKNIERRAYEVIRLVHFWCGYGLRQEGDKIFLVE